MSGAAAVSWVAGHPRFAALSRPARAKAWSVADSNDSGTLDHTAFTTFVKELDEAATASDASTPVAAAAAAGLVVGGPPGAVVLGGLTAGYQSLSRVGQSAFVGGLGGMLAAGPPGAVAGAVVGAGGQRVADESYLGDPRRWSQYADLATRALRSGREAWIRKVSSLWTRAPGSSSETEGRGPRSRSCSGRACRVV